MYHILVIILLILLILLGIYILFIKNKIENYESPCKNFDNNIRMITFSDGVKYKFDRIVKEAENSKYFKEIKAFSPKDFDEEFKKNHNDFIQNNKRGYGYWLWKSYFILRNLQELNEGDYLIYADSGCKIQSGNPKRISEYYEMLKNYDMITFNIFCEEKTWCKMDTVNAILKKLGKKPVDIKIPFEIDSKARCATVLLMKKSPVTMEIIKLWIDICITDNYHNIDDTPSTLENDKTFKEHRHDQSIISCITKFYPSVLVLKDNYLEKDDDRFEYKFENGDIRPFIFSRIAK
jgi:hypothetical protein